MSGRSKSKKKKSADLNPQRKDSNSIWATKSERVDSSVSGVQSILSGSWDSIIEMSADLRSALSARDISGILTINGVARNAVEYPATDSLRNWFYIVEDSVDEDATRLTNKQAHPKNVEIQERLTELKAHDRLYDYLTGEAATGSALLYMDVNTTRGGNNSDRKLDIQKIKKVNFLTVWDQFTVSKAKVNNYPLSKEYKEIQSFVLRNNAVIDASRVKFLSTRAQQDSVFGHSILVPMELTLDAQRTLIWSIGEIAHSMLFKVLKTKNVDFSKTDDYKARIKLLRDTLSTNDLVAIGDEEDLAFRTPGDLPRVMEMSSILWEMLSCVTRVPKSILLGKTEGKVAGAEYDHISYYMRLVSLQKKSIEPVLRWIIDALFVEMGMPGEKYKIIFNPLWDTSDEMDAKIRKLESEVDLNTAKTEEIVKRIEGLVEPPADPGPAPVPGDE